MSAPLTDLEKSGVSVRTLVIVCACLIFTGGGMIVAATVSWVDAQNQLDALVKGQQTMHEQLLTATSFNEQLTTQILTLSQQVATLQKRMDDYRPFKWSTPMMIEYSEELNARNSHLTTPDPQEIHDKVLPFTPQVDTPREGMTLREQWQSVNTSAVANAAARAFLLGFGFVAGERLLAGGFDVVSVLTSLTDRAWLLTFLRDGFNSALLAALGVLSPNLFAGKTSNPSPVVLKEIRPPSSL